MNYITAIRIAMVRADLEKIREMMRSVEHAKENVPAEVAVAGFESAYALGRAEGIAQTAEIYANSALDTLAKIEARDPTA